MKILLIRHGESLGDVDHKIRSTMPDNKISLTDKGIEQAKALSTAIKSNLNKLSPKPFDKYNHNVVIEFSPFERTRQTKDILLDGLKNTSGIDISNINENFLISEQQFGLYNGLTGDEIRKLYPIEHDWHQKYLDHESRFFSPIPMGESRFQVALRAKLFLEDIKKRYSDLNNLIVVSHATFIRAFIMVMFNKSPEWFDNEPKPNNCSIRFVEYNSDNGYIFDGFKT